MKKLPIEERKVSTTFALSLKALEKLDEIQRLYPGKSRSYALEQIIGDIYTAWFTDQNRPEPLEKQKLSSVYGEVHYAEQTDHV